MKTTSSNSFSERQQREIFFAFLPALCYALAKEGLLSDQDTASREKVLNVIRKHHRVALKKAQVGVAMHETFIREADRLWKKGQKVLGVVLFATAAEQVMNQIYRILMEAQGMKTEEATTLLRYLNADAKLVGMLPLLTGQRLKKPLIKRLKKLFEIRNSIVHFKSVGCSIDSDSDSYSTIESELGNLRGVSVSRDFGRLADALWGAMRKKCREMDIAIKAVDIVKKG
jgi:hypothetical protein